MLYLMNVYDGFPLHMYGIIDHVTIARLQKRNGRLVPGVVVVATDNLNPHVLL